MNPRSYVDLKEGGRNLQPTYYFMINCLLYSRMETGLVSNQDYYDEDVNVYMAHLLHSFINPEYVEQSKKYLSKYDADVFRRLSSSTDARLKYAIYKTNADFLLVSIGIFDNPLAPTSASKAKPAPSEEAYIGRGKTYYHFAYTYSQQIHRRNQGVSEVLEKLSVGFEKYIKILSHMRGEYLDLTKRFSDGEVYHLERSINESMKQELIRAKQDQLLELYTAWQREPSAEIEGDVERLVSEIQELHPSFKFSLPRTGSKTTRRRTDAVPETSPEASASAGGSAPIAKTTPPGPPSPPQAAPARNSTPGVTGLGTATGTAPEPKRKPRTRNPRPRGTGGADTN
jgi:hypothetical protein